MNPFCPPRPYNPAHAPDAYRMTKIQVGQLETRHANCEKEGDECPPLIAARTADLVAEVMTCPECRHGTPNLVWQIVQDTQFAASVMMCLASAVCSSDNQIMQGLDNWESMSPEDQERIRAEHGWGSDFDFGS
jgi:hypothetical protein